MAARLLHSLTDDNPDLQKQIGCMTGIFQIFDSHHILTGRRITGHNPKRLPAGSSHFDVGTFESESKNIYNRSTATEKHCYKNVPEKHRVSPELSRASFSSSSRSSSFSSVDCNKISQPEPSSFDRIIFPETPSRDPTMSQSSASPQFGRQSLDLRDVVKDSMYREARGLSVKTTAEEEAAERVVKHRDSPRPLQLSKTSDGPYSMGPNGKQNLPVDIKESLRILPKLQEAHRYFNEPRELTRSSSCHSKDGSLFSFPKDAPRFSYDGREINSLSFESRETAKSTQKLKELPRLSLDSREGSMRSLISDSKSSFVSQNSDKDSGNSSNKVLSLQQTSGTQSRPPSVVAKLMGLDHLPDPVSASYNKMDAIRAHSVVDSDPFSTSSTATDLCRPIRTANPSRNSWREPTSPRWKNPDSVMRPISKFPIEPAPWKQFDGTRDSQKLASRSSKAAAKAPNPFPSVYSEIEKRLKDLEFTQSGKDLRALKHILEAMQAKGLLDTRQEGQDSNFTIQKDHEQRYMNSIQKTKVVHQRNLQSDNVIASANRRTNSLRNFESPIVIMKPAKLVEKSGIPGSSVIPPDGLFSLSKPQSGDFAENRKGSENTMTATEQVPNMSHKDNAVHSTDIKSNGRDMKLIQTLTKPRKLPKEISTRSIKSSGSISPRMHKKKLELEKRSRPPTSPSDSSISRMQSNKQQSESSSPGRRRRPKSSSFQQSDDQLSEISSETRNLSYQESNISLQSDVNIVSDIKVISSARSAVSSGSQSPSVKAAGYSISGSVSKKSNPMLSEDESLVVLATVAPEYPSPISVLDNAMYMDDASSPVKQIPKALKDDGTWDGYHNSTKKQWNPAADNLVADTMGSGLTSNINRKKLQNIEHLVQKLRRLNSSHDEARTDYIASLCENTNPDHRYISEILLASGLLLRDLGASLTTFQFHPSGHPINPELFLVLEQTKASTSLKEECSIFQLKPDKEKIDRRLIFDAVNEILVRKLAFGRISSELRLRPHKLARKTMNAQKLLRELCLEIEELQIMKSGCNTEDEDNGLRNILWEDVMRWSESWTDFNGEISGLVLDVERLIFKDLIDEIVIGEATVSRVKPGRRSRQLFAK